MKYLNIAGYLAIPLAFAVHLWLAAGKSWEPVATFVLAALGVIPLAHLMGVSTEHLAEKTGPTWGGLLNATFGNAAELIIAIIALTKGMNEVVKASLTGSILGNLLLVGGGAMLVGGWKREKQSFSAAAAEANAGLLVIAVAAMLLPAMFHHSAAAAGDLRLSEHEHAISYGASAILLLVYGAGLLFTLRTHAHIFSREPRGSKPPASADHASWSVGRSIGMLLLASAGIGVVAELLVGSAQAMAATMGWNPIFVGVILLAIVGNAAEHSTALMMAHRDDMDTAMTITYQSSLQIALFAVPLLIFISLAFVAMGIQDGPGLDMLFTPMEVVSVILAVGIVVVLGSNGKTNWFEGVLLLALYAVLIIVFFYIPTTAGQE